MEPPPKVSFVDKDRERGGEAADLRRRDSKQRKNSSEQVNGESRRGGRSREALEMVQERGEDGTDVSFMADINATGLLTNS
mgnify:CR=1 FL=1